MPQGRRGSKKLSDDNRSIMDMMGGKEKKERKRSRTAGLPAGIKRKASPVKEGGAPALTGKRKRRSKELVQQTGGEDDDKEMQDAEGDAEMSEASDALVSSDEEDPRPKKVSKKRVRAPSRRMKAVEVDKDLLAELGLSDDDDDAGIDELLNSATLAVKKGPRIQNNMSRILSTREEEMSDGERQELILRLDEEEAEEDEEEDKEDEGEEELRSMRILGGASFGLQSQRLMDTLAQSGGDVEKLVRYNFINWDPEKRENLHDLVLPELYDVLNTSPSALAPKKHFDKRRLPTECSFLTTSGWLQLFRKNLNESSRDELCMFLFRIVVNSDETHVRASAFHLLDAIMRDEDTVALSSVAEVAPSMMLVGDGWALPYHLFLRSIEAFGMDVSSFIPSDPDDDAPLLEMGTAFSTTEPKGSETFPQKNLILVVRLMEASVNAKPDMYSADELVDMVLLAFCFILDPWLEQGVLVLESFITSCLNAFTAKQWRTGAVEKICQKLSDPTILADETQLVGALQHIAISMPKEGGVDRGRLVKGHASVMALCSVLEIDLPELDFAAFPPLEFVIDIVNRIREDADRFTDAAKAQPGQKKRDYTRLYAMLCLLDTAIDKRLYEAARNRASVKSLSTAIRLLDTRIKDKGGVLHLARKRVKEKLLMLQCTVDILLI